MVALLALLLVPAQAQEGAPPPTEGLTTAAPQPEIIVSVEAGESVAVIPGFEDGRRLYFVEPTLGLRAAAVVERWNGTDGLAGRAQVAVAGGLACNETYAAQVGLVKLGRTSGRIIGAYLGAGVLVGVEALRLPTRCTGWFGTDKEGIRTRWSAVLTGHTEAGLDVRLGNVHIRPGVSAQINTTGGYQVGPTVTLGMSLPSRKTGFDGR